MYARRAKLDEGKKTLHALRHTSAKLRRAAGEDLLAIKKLLHHSSLETTFRYVQRIESPIDPRVSALENTLSRFS